MAGKSLKERFEEKYIPEPNTGCWLWMAFADKDGYGRIKTPEKTLLAHRFSWMFLVGSIPKGKLVCHKCDTPACVNPKHLFIGSMKDNILDSVAKKRHFETRKTHCKWGHEFLSTNTQITTKGRLCLICRKRNNKKKTNS